MSNNTIMVIVALVLSAGDMLRAVEQHKFAYGALACMWALVAGLYMARMVMGA